MYYVIEMTSEKMDEFKENLEKAQKFIGKAMQCAAEMEEKAQSGGMGQRESMGYRMERGGGYGNRMGNRDGMGYRSEQGGGYGNRMMGEQMPRPEYAGYGGRYENY